MLHGGHHTLLPGGHDLVRILASRNLIPEPASLGGQARPEVERPRYRTNEEMIRRLRSPPEEPILGDERETVPMLGGKGLIAYH